MTEAERLAEALDVCEISKTGMSKAAAELRRLSSINAELVHALETAIPFLEDAETDYTYNTAKVKGKLKLVRAALEKAKQ